MISKIINMAERIKDAEDRLLESMFESAPVADDGFSVNVVRRLNRRLWLRRLTLPVAAAIGASVAIKPLTGLVKSLSGLVALIPQDLLSTTTSLIPQAQTIVLGAMLLAAILLGVRALEE